MLSVIIYSGLEGIWRGIEYGFDSYSKETNLADEWVFASYFTDDDIVQIEKMNGVSEVSKRLRFTAASENGGKDTYLSLDTFETSTQVRFASTTASGTPSFPYST